MEHYMVDKLSVTEYPTHILIDKEGKILKVVNKIDELIPFFKREIEKTEL